MVLKEGQPALSGIAAAVNPTEVARDASFRDIEAELKEFAMDLWCSPTGILLRKPTDQIADLARNPWSARTPTRTPPPVPTKASSVPRDHCVGIHDKEHVLPARPEAAECNPEQPIGGVQRWARPLSFEDAELLSECDDLKRCGSARAKEHADAG